MRLMTWLGSIRRKVSASHSPLTTSWRCSACGIERLETRTLLSADVLVAVDGAGNLLLQDLNGVPNNITVTRNNVTHEIVVQSTTDELQTNVGSPTNVVRISENLVRAILADLGNGADRLDLTALFLSATVLGGSGNDTILTGSGDDNVNGQGADDFLDKPFETEALLASLRRMASHRAVDFA